MNNVLKKISLFNDARSAVIIVDEASQVLEPMKTPESKYLPAYLILRSALKNASGKSHMELLDSLRVKEYGPNIDLAKEVMEKVVGDKLKNPYPTEMQLKIVQTIRNIIVDLFRHLSKGWVTVSQFLDVFETEAIHDVRDHRYVDVYGAMKFRRYREEILACRDAARAGICCETSTSADETDLDTPRDTVHIISFVHEHTKTYQIWACLGSEHFGSLVERLCSMDLVKAANTQLIQARDTPVSEGFVLDPGLTVENLYGTEIGMEYDARGISKLHNVLHVVSKPVLCSPTSSTPLFRPELFSEPVALLKVSSSGWGHKVDSYKLDNVADHLDVEKPPSCETEEPTQLLDEVFESAQTTLSRCQRLFNANLQHLRLQVSGLLKALQADTLAEAHARIADLSHTKKKHRSVMDKLEKMLTSVAK